MSYLNQFMQQWKSYLQSELDRCDLKYIISTLGDDVDIRENSYNYFNWLRRVPITKPRSIKTSVQFQVPEEHKEDFQNFCEIVQKGHSLRLFGSRRNLKRGKEKYRDGLFEDWGISHFHFRETGTKEVIFAVVEPETLYLLMVASHGKGEPDIWVKKALIECLHLEFPHLIAYRQLGSNQSHKTTSEIDHKLARKLRVNMPIVMNDGTQYFPPGSGVLMANGTVTDYSAWVFFVRQLRELADNAEKEVPAYAKRLNIDESSLQVQLDFSYDYTQNLFYVNGNCF